MRSCSGAIQRDAATQVLPDCVYPLWHPVSLNLAPPPEQSELTTEQEEQIPFDGQKLSEYPEQEFVVQAFIQVPLEHFLPLGHPPQHSEVLMQEPLHSFLPCSAQVLARQV